MQSKWLQREWFHCFRGPWLKWTAILKSNFTSSSYVTHYNDVIMSLIGSQIASLMIVYLTVYSGADQRKHISSVSLAFVRGIHWWPVNSLNKWPVMRKMFLFDDVIMLLHVHSCSQCVCVPTTKEILLKCIYMYQNVYIYMSSVSKIHSNFLVWKSGHVWCITQEVPFWHLVMLLC